MKVARICQICPEEGIRQHVLQIDVGIVLKIRRCRGKDLRAPTVKVDLNGGVDARTPVGSSVQNLNAACCHDRVLSLTTISDQPAASASAFRWTC